MRGIAALSVAYFHIAIIARRFLDINYNGPLASAGNLGVDFFFVLSGFIITWVHHGDFGKRSELARYSAKRAVRIFPLLWIIVTVKLAALIALPTLSPVAKVNAETVAVSYFLIPAQSYIIDVQWTLVYEVIFYVLFGVGLYLGRRAALVMALVWVTAISAARIMGESGPPVIYLQHLLSPNNFQFLAGAATAVLLRRSFLAVGPAVLTACCGLGATVVGLVLGWKDHLYWACAFSLLVAGGASIDAARKWRVPRVAILFGDASYSIYLLHTSVQMVMVVAGKKAGLPMGSGGQILLHIIGIVSVICGLLCYRYVEKPILNYFGRILSRPDR